MTDTVMTALSIGVIAVATWFCRSAAFIVFGGKKEIPKAVIYLGKVLPPAIMAILVFYCLRNLEITKYPFGLADNYGGVCRHTPVEEGKYHSYDCRGDGALYGAYKDGILNMINGCAQI